jgi:hypothetical protein
MCATKPAVVFNTPIPYFTLHLKLIEEASLKYLVGQEISPIRKPNIRAWAIIRLSKTKSSETSPREVHVADRRRGRRFVPRLLVDRDQPV